MIILSIIAGVCELVGGWILGNKKRFGFILFAISGICWIIVGIHKSLPGLLIVCIPGLFINTRNFRKWKK